jgi:hypothetical protein
MPAQPAKRRPETLPLTAGRFQTVEAYLAAGGIIKRLPPAYVAPSQQGALPPDEARRRIEQIVIPPPIKLNNRFLFGGPRPR